MGVKYCMRKGCENIMCERWSPTYGHICEECFNELLDTDGLTIEEFMRTSKEEIYEDNVFDSWIKLCNEEFPLQSLEELCGG